jgi:hypothetical protein
MSLTWKTYRVEPGKGGWEPASYNIRTADGREYGRWRRVLRQHPLAVEVRFASDSLLEKTGFEPSVPRRRIHNEAQSCRKDRPDQFKNNAAALL